MQDETLGVTQLVNGAWSRVPQRRKFPEVHTRGQAMAQERAMEPALLRPLRL